jgi:hypothetical protein
MNLVAYAIEISRWLAGKCSVDLRQLACDPIDGFVRKIFSFQTAAARKDLYQSRADSFVFLRGDISIWVKPGE